MLIGRRLAASPSLVRRVRRRLRLVQGRTLIELLIAMTISMIILLGVSLYYSSAAKTSRVALQMSAIHEDAPIAMLVAGNMIRRAGYGEIVGTGFAPDGQTLLSGPHLRACKGSNFTNPAAGDFSCTGTATGDALMVSFQADSVVASAQRRTAPCTRDTAPAITITDAAHVANGMAVPMVRSIFQLSNGGLACSDIGGGTEILANDVTDFRVFFGYDRASAQLALGGGTSAAATGAVLMDASQIQTASASFPAGGRSAWDYVVSVHLCMVLKTRQAATSVTAGDFSYTGCPTTAAQAASGTGPALTAANGTIHKTFNQVITVRARATGSPSVAL